MISDYVDKRRRPNSYIVRAQVARLMAKQESNEESVQSVSGLNALLLYFLSKRKRRSSSHITSNWKQLSHEITMILESRFIK